MSEPSNQRQDIDDILRDHGEKLSSELLLHVLCGYRKLGRGRILEFFSLAGLHLRFRLDDAVVDYMADFFGRRKLFDDLECLPRRPAPAGAGCSIFIRVLGRQGSGAGAPSLFVGMEKVFNCTPNNLVFNNVRYMLRKMSLTDDSIEIALAVFRRIRSPDEYSHSNLLVGRGEHALSCSTKWPRLRFPPIRSAGHVLIGELCELGVKSEAVGKVPVRVSKAV